MNATLRLSKIRSIIKESEKAIERSEDNQLPILRSAIMDIILAAGPQPSGKKKNKELRMINAT